jgi:hypothetical protein
MRPEVDRDGGKPIVRMYFREGPNVREVQWAGFGFQVWMQTMTHLRQANSSSVLILDEPDVYLHPDLQHKLMRIVNDRVGQVFVATHSTEIINEADPGDVLIIRASARGAKRIHNDNDYPQIYAAIGSSENAQFARLARTKKVLYFEGNDARLLSKVAKRIGMGDFINAASLTLMKSGGFSNWPKVSNSSWVFKNFFDFDIPVAALFDRDYRCQEEVDGFLEDVNTSDTLCRVLPFKELENILLVPRAIKSVVKKFSSDALPPDFERVVDEIIEACCESVKTRALSNLIGSRAEYESRKGSRRNLSSTSADVEKCFSASWTNLSERLSILPGKALFSDITGKIQDRFRVTLTEVRVVDELTTAEIEPKFIDILQEIRSHLDV